MGWEILAPLIIKEGFTFAYQVWKNHQSKELPTEAQWAELRALKTAQEIHDEVAAEKLPPLP